MPSLGAPEILVILLVALLIFGPKRLPEVGRQVAKGYRELRRFQDNVREEIDDVLRLDEAEPVRAAPPAPPEPAGQAGATGSRPSRFRSPGSRAPRLRASGSPVPAGTRPEPPAGPAASRPPARHRPPPRGVTEPGDAEA